MQGLEQTPLHEWLPDHVGAGMPRRSASNARTSVTYCKPSNSGIRCSKSWSVGSLIQPSMGIALSIHISAQSAFGASWSENLTWMENVTKGAVIKYHYLAQIRLDLSKILDVSPVANCAMLPVVPPGKVLALYLQPIDNRIGVLLHRSGEYNKIVPFADLGQESVGCWSNRIGHRTFLRKSSQYGRLWT